MVVKKYGSMKAIYTGYNKEKYLPLSYSIKENTVYNIVLVNIYESKNSQNSNDNFDDYYHICVFDDNGNNLDDIIYQNFKDFSLDWIFVYDHESIEPNKATAKSDTEKTQAIYCGDGMVCRLINDKIYNIKISDIFDCGRSIHNKDKAHCIYCVDVYDDTGNKIIDLVYYGIIPFLKNWIVVTGKEGFYSDIRNTKISKKNIKRRGDTIVTTSEFNNKYVIHALNQITNMEEYKYVYKPVSRRVIDILVSEIVDRVSKLLPGNSKIIEPVDYDYAIKHLSHIHKKSDHYIVENSDVDIHYGGGFAYIRVKYNDKVKCAEYALRYEPIFGIDVSDMTKIDSIVNNIIESSIKEVNNEQD